MSSPPFLATGNLQQVVAATNNVISHINNTAAFLLVSQTDLPRVSRGNISLWGKLTVNGSLLFQNGTVLLPLPTNQRDGFAGTSLNTTSVFVGTPTANALLTFDRIVLANATSNTTLTSASLRVGANAVLNTTTLFLGNSTANTVLTSTRLATANAMGAAVLTPTRLTISSTEYSVATVLRSTGLTLPPADGLNTDTTNLLENRDGALFFDGAPVGSGSTPTSLILPPVLGLTTDSTNLLENRNGQLFFNGRRVDLVNEYAATYGYVMGGYIGDNFPNTTTLTDRLTFSNSLTAASTVSNLSRVRSFALGISDCAVYGYALGGYGPNDGFDEMLATTDRVTFSTSVTTASSVSDLSGVGKFGGAAVSDGAVYGYAFGGYANGLVTATDRITFSTGITAVRATSAPTLGRVYYASSLSDGAVYGYLSGGFSGFPTPPITLTERLTFSTGVPVAHTISHLLAARTYGIGISDGSVYGYSVSGTDASGGYSSLAERLAFSTGIFASSSASALSTSRGGISGVSDGAMHGYALGGVTISGNDGMLEMLFATADRLTFSTSVAAVSTTSNLSVSRSDAAGLSDGAV